MLFFGKIAMAAVIVVGGQAFIASVAAQDAPGAAATPSLLDRAVNGVRVTSIRISGLNQTNSTIDSDVQGGKAIRVVVAAAAANPWDVTAVSVTNKAVEQGDKLVMAVWLRAEPGAASTSPGNVSLRLQQTAAPYTGVAVERVEIGSEWTLYFAKGTASQAYAAGALAATVQLGIQAQTIDVGPTFILAMGPDFDLSTIPAN